MKRGGISTRDKIIGFSLLLGLVYWFVDAILNHYFYFYRGSLIEMLILDIPTNALLLRLFVFTLFILSGSLVARIVERREKSEETQLLLYKIAYSVNTTRNVKELYEAIREHVGKIVDTTNFYIVLYDSESEKFSLPYYVDEYHKGDEFKHIEPGGTLSAYVIRKDKPLLATEEVIRELEKSGFGETLGNPSKVWAGVPLQVGKDVLGAMVVKSYKDVTFYTKDDLNLLESISEQVALSIKQKQALDTEKELAREKRVILDSISEVLIYMDTERKVIWANKLAGNFANKEPDELVGKYCYELWQNQKEFCLECPVVEAIETGRYHELEKTTENGRKWYLRANPVKNVEGKVVGVVESALNITEQKRLEEQLRQAQKMETVGRLAGGISHDFNNLLTAISGYASFLKQEIPDGDNRKEEVNQIIKAAERATSLTDRLLAFSRRKPLKPKIININNLIFEIDKMLRRIITENIELVIIPTEKIGAIRADPVHIEQVLVNLILNSKEAMPEGGKITIKTTNVTLDDAFVEEHPGSKIGKYVKLSVIDTGMGMNEEIMRHVFEPFFTTKEKMGGTGLGLSTVYGIVKQHKGYIHFDSTPGEGTTANIYLPRVEGEIKIKREKKKDKLPEGSETILFAEDEALVRNYVQKVLERLGYKVLSAANGEEALRLSKEYKDKIHLLLTDLVMPKLGGKELARRISRERKGIKILFISGYSDEIQEEQGLIFKGNNFMQKPFKASEIATRIRNILDEAK